jgi:AcrR family transcriptional regulator
MGAATKMAVRPQVDTADTRDALLAAARQIFSRKGYHGTNVSDIVSAVGMAQGSFYNYFRNKKGIFEELLQAFADRIAACVEAVDLKSIKDETSYHLVGLALGTQLSRIFLDQRELAQIFFREASVEPEFDQMVNEAYRRVTEATQAYVARGQEVGVVRDDISAAVTANAMVGMCSHLIQRSLRGDFDGMDPNALLQTLVSIHLRGILK